MIFSTFAHVFYLFALIFFLPVLFRFSLVFIVNRGYSARQCAQRHQKDSRVKLFLKKKKANLFRLAFS